MVRAVLSDLTHRHNLSRGARIIFGGASAGGRGAMVHLDRVSSYLSVPARVVGLLDSAMWIDMLPDLPSSFQGFASVTKCYPPSLPSLSFTKPSYRSHHLCGRQVFANANVDVDKECSSFYPEERWRCMFGEYTLPRLRSPYLAIGSQHDSFQLLYNLPDGRHRSAEGRAYLANFAQRTTQLCDKLANNSTFSSYRVVFSSRCHRHAVSTDPDFFDSRCLGASMEDALLRLLRATYWRPREVSSPSSRAKEGDNNRDLNQLSSSYIDRSECRANALECRCCPVLQTSGEKLFFALQMAALVVTPLVMYLAYYFVAHRYQCHVAMCPRRWRKWMSNPLSGVMRWRNPLLVGRSSEQPMAPAQLPALEGL